MRPSTKVTVALVLVASSSRLIVGQSGAADQTTTGTISGHVEGPIPMGGLEKASVYLFTLTQSKRLREMDSCAYARAHKPGVDKEEVNSIDIGIWDTFADLLPTLPRTALTHTDGGGNYKFARIPAGARYYVVAVRVGEDGVFLAAAVTPILKAGQRIRFDLRVDAPWEERFKLR